MQSKIDLLKLVLSLRNYLTVICSLVLNNFITLFSIIFHRFN